MFYYLKAAFSGARSAHKSGSKTTDESDRV
jgi:hypothetical protein